MDKNTQRRYVKARRRWKDERRQSESCSKPTESNVDANTPSTSSFKRTNDNCSVPPVKRFKGEAVSPPSNDAKYSANDRLKKYRKTLAEKKQQRLKVHKVLLDDLPSDVGTKPLSLPPAKQSNIAKISSATLTSSQCSNNKVDLSEVIRLPVIESTNFNFNMGPSMVNDDNCDMDWSPISQEEVVSDIQKLRETIKEQPHPSYSLLNTQTSPPKQKLSGENLLYIIVDTNIFISHLAVIKDITKILKYDEYKPTVYVPWMVIQELDYFKDGRTGSTSMQNTAKRAVAFINEMLTNKNKALKGQTVHEALDHKFSNANADDCILFCCMQLRQNGERMILLSNDVNLRNKALINDIEAYGPNCIMEKIKQICCKKGPNGKVEAIKTIFLNTCSEIVKFELEQAYGSATYNMISKPPWTLNECLRYLKRFWSPVFSLIITQKQCAKAIDDLLQFLQVHKEISENDIDQFIKLVLCICVFFKNCLVKYNDMMKSCISQIQKHL